MPVHANGHAGHDGNGTSPEVTLVLLAMAPTAGDKQPPSQLVGPCRVEGARILVAVDARTAAG